jgi:SulP family sulfate permease
VLTTLVVIFKAPLLLKKVLGDLAKFFPSTLIAVVAVSLFTHLLSLDVQLIQLSAGLSSWDEFGSLVMAQIPTDWSLSVLITALPFAIQLALLGYLDSLLTSRIVDKISGEKTRQGKELVAQGIANTAVTFVGGIPGAQATIRSVLMHKENATMRIAGVATGLFVLLEVILSQDILRQIPQAVFVGILMKVGHDVFDYEPFKVYWAKMRKTTEQTQPPFSISHVELGIIIGCSLVTVLVNLNAAVIGFTILFYVYNKWVASANPLKDMTV